MGCQANIRRLSMKPRMLGISLECTNAASLHPGAHHRVPPNEGSKFGRSFKKCQHVGPHRAQKLCWFLFAISINNGLRRCSGWEVVCSGNLTRAESAPRDGRQGVSSQIFCYRILNDAFLVQSSQLLGLPKPCLHARFATSARFWRFCLWAKSWENLAKKVILHAILLGVGGSIYTSNTLPWHSNSS